MDKSADIRIIQGNLLKRGQTMRTINVNEITEQIKEMCIEANHYLSKDMDIAMKRAEEEEAAPLEKNFASAPGKFRNCSKRYHSYMSGYRYGQ